MRKWLAGWIRRKLRIVSPSGFLDAAGADTVAILSAPPDPNAPRMDPDRFAEALLTSRRLGLLGGDDDFYDEPDE